MPEGPLGGPRPAAKSYIKIVVMLKTERSNRDEELASKVDRVVSSNLGVPIVDSGFESFRGELNYTVTVDQDQHTNLTGIPVNALKNTSEKIESIKNHRSKILGVAINTQ